MDDALDEDLTAGTSEPDWWEDDRWPEDLEDQYGPPEPDFLCWTCEDNTMVAPGLLARLAGYTIVRCPSCNPNRLVRLYQWSQLWRIRGAVYRLFHPLPDPADEPPF